MRSSTKTDVLITLFYINGTSIYGKSINALHANMKCKGVPHQPIYSSPHGQVGMLFRVFVPGIVPSSREVGYVGN